MSADELNRFCHRLTADPATRAAARADLPSALAGFGLTSAERTAVISGDVGTLLGMGVHPVLLVRMCTYGIADLTEHSYSQRIRAAYPGPGPEPESAGDVRPSLEAERWCLITGATGGLGRALATEFGKEGYRLLLTGRDATALRDLGDMAGERAVTMAADLSEPAGVRRITDEVRMRTTRLHAVVLSAGIAVGGTFLAPEQPLERWRDAVLVNLFGPAAVARAMLPLLVQARGSLVFVGSVTGRAAVPGDLYSVTKHAVSALAESVRLEAEPLGVQVCVVQPGLMDTPMVRGERRARPMTAPELIAREVTRLTRPDRPYQVAEVVIRPPEGDTR